MRNELGFSTTIQSFDDLKDVLAGIDEYSVSHKKLIAKYDDRLGYLLRNNEGLSANVGTETASRKEVQAVAPNRQQESSSVDTNNGQWISFGIGNNIVFRAASGNKSFNTMAEISALFQIVEMLKSKVSLLESAKKQIAELPNKGFKPNQTYVVVFRDGIPRQIFPAENDQRNLTKFSYTAKFEIAVLK